MCRYDLGLCAAYGHPSQVILVSGSTPFKVYKGLLARESEFFEELFRAPPMHLFFDRRVEECEVMRLENSKAKQLGPVLKWIHFGIGKYASHILLRPRLLISICVHVQTIPKL